MSLALYLVLLAAVLWLCQELLRRANKWIAWGIFLVLPLVLIPYWRHLSESGIYAGRGMFPWVKLASLQLAVSWLTALRFTRLGQSRGARALMFLLLPINMFEAVTLDLHGGHLAHWLLAGSGLLLIIAVPHPLWAIRVDEHGPWRDLLYVGMTRTWIVGYTLWNAAFVYLNFPEIAGHQLAVLAAPLVVGMRRPALWLQARGFTLGVDLLLMATFPELLFPLLDSASWATPGREDYVALGCLFYAAYYAGFHLLRKKEPLLPIESCSSNAAHDPHRSS